MKTPKYDGTNKHVPPIGFGGWQLGNADHWGKMDFEEGVDLVRKAYQRGVRLFDTAPNYAGGMSEAIIGEALKDVRNDVVINTKIGHRADGEIDFSLEAIEASVKSSLKRLNTDYLDSVILHNPGLEILSGDDHFAELDRLKRLGSIKAYGVSIDTYEEFEMVLNHTECDVVEVLFNIFFQDVYPLFERAKEQNVAVIVKVPLDSGWLTGKYDAHSTFTGIRSRWDEDTIKRRGALVDKVKNITGKDDLTTTALAFILGFDGVTAVIPGIRNEQHLNVNLQAADMELPDAMRERLIKLYQEEIKDEPLPW